MKHQSYYGQKLDEGYKDGEPIVQITPTPYGLKVGDIISMPIERRRTFWEWLTRKKPTTEIKVFKITKTYFEGQKI